MRAASALLVIISLLAIVLSWWQLSAPQRVDRARWRDGVPLLYLVRTDACRRPACSSRMVCGFKQVMLGYGYTLAHAGYAVLLWDFDGHAAVRRRWTSRVAAERRYGAAALRSSPRWTLARLRLSDTRWAAAWQ